MAAGFEEICGASMAPRRLRMPAIMAWREYSRILTRENQDVLLERFMRGTESN
jgi:hypothetical protein